jgi:GH35 family endo-1,4-beta-xylanase
MKSNKYIIPLALVSLALTGCDDQIMEWQDKDNTIGVADLPLELKEKLANYEPIKNYVKQYHPNLNFALGMGADMYLSNATYKALVDENFTGVTLGNAMKFGVVCGNSGSLNFNTVDQIMASLPSDMKLYGHNLLWHTQQPQTYLKSLISPKMIITTDGGGVANMLAGDATNFNGGTTGGWGSWGGNKDADTGIDSTGGKDGSACMKLVNTGDGNYWDAQFAYTFDSPLSSGETYVIKFKAKSSTAAGKLQFQYQNGTTYGSQGAYNEFSVGTSWTEYEYEFTPTHDDANRIILNFGKVDGTYWIDDIEFGIKVVDTMDNVLTGDSSDFEGGTKGGWGAWGSNFDSSSVEEGAGNNGSYGVVLANKGDGNAWEAQFAYTFDTPLKDGTIYVIKFDAKSSSAAGEMQFQYQNSTTYGSQGAYNTFNIGTDWTTFEYEFTCGHDDADRIILNFGKVGATYYIDNIKFGEKKDQTASAAPAKVIKYAKRAKGAKRRASTITYELKTAAEKREILLGAMEDWIKSMMQHVGDRVDAWDVINEPISDGNNKWRGIDGTFGGSDNDGNADSAPTESTDAGLTLNWATDSGNQHWYWGYYLGKDYAVKAFEFARKYSPNGAKLFVNDYNLETSPAKLQALIEFVNYIDANGGHVDGIGSQMHVSKSITKAEVDAMFKTLAATGKLVRITELDVAMDTATPSTEQAATQAEIYQMIIESYFENVPESQQSSITLWTLSDNAKEHEYWLNGDTPNIFDTNYERKHAYKAVCDAIAGFDISSSFSGTDWKNQYQNTDK